MEKPQSQLNIYPNFGLFLVNNVLIERVQFSRSVGSNWRPLRFCIGIFLRGINFYQIPTTLLAMVDSSVGGKTGINLKAGKKSSWCISPTKRSFIDLSLLKTLPKREFSAGMAEVIKYGLLGNKGLFKILSDFPTPICSKSSELSEIIKICCLIRQKLLKKMKLSQFLHRVVEHY